MQSVLDVIEDYIGTSVNQKTLQIFNTLSYLETIELFESISEYYSKDSIVFPSLSYDEVRYAILTDTYGDKDSYEIWNDSEYLKKLLLYYPSVSVLDPIDEVLNQLLDSPSLIRYNNPIEQLLPVFSLIRKGVIRLVPIVSAGQSLSKNIDISSVIKDAFIENDIFEVFRVYDPENYDLIKNTKLNLPGFSLNNNEKEVLGSLVRNDIPIGLLIWAASIVKDAYKNFLIADLADSNIAFIDERQAKLFSCLSGGKSNILHELGDSDDFISSNILSLSLPNIVNLSMEDIVSIRENDDDFYFWRVAFKRVLEESYNYNKFSTKNFLRNAKEILSAESRSLRKSIDGKKSLKGKILESFIPAGIGFAAGALTGALEVAATSSAITGSLSLLYSLFVKRPTKSDESLLRHFAIFLDNYKS